MGNMLDTLSLATAWFFLEQKWIKCFPVKEFINFSINISMSVLHTHFSIHKHNSFLPFSISHKISHPPVTSLRATISKGSSLSFPASPLSLPSLLLPTATLTIKFKQWTFGFWTAVTIILHTACTVSQGELCSEGDLVFFHGYFLKKAPITHNFAQFHK